ncbi:hypothetical protein STEG23_000475, partial [Scotinomys teguina]
DFVVVIFLHVVLFIQEKKVCVTSNLKKKDDEIDHIQNTMSKSEEEPVLFVRRELKTKTTNILVNPSLQSLEHMAIFSGLYLRLLLPLVTASLFILDINLLSDEEVVKIFSHSVCCLALLMVPFALQKLVQYI